MLVKLVKLVIKASKASSKSPRQVDDKNAEPSLQHACLKGSQFTCFTGTKVLALMVQKKDDDTSAEHSLQQTSSTLSLYRLSQEVSCYSVWGLKLLVYEALSY